MLSREWIETNLNSDSGWDRSKALLVKIIWEGAISAIIPAIVTLGLVGGLVFAGSSLTYALTVVVAPVGVGGTAFILNQAWCFLTE